MNFLLDRLKEKSTWGSVSVLVATLVGTELSPELRESIVTLGISIVGLIAILTKEEKKQK